MKKYILDDSESKTLLEMAVDCIDKGMVGENYEIDKINDIIDYSYELYGKSKQEIEVEVEVKVKLKTK